MEIVRGGFWKSDTSTDHKNQPNMRLLILCMMLFFAVVVFAQTNGPQTPKWGFNSQFLLSKNDNPTLASVQNVEFAARAAAATDCHKYKNMKRLGIIFSAVGGGVLTTGIILVGVGSSYYDVGMIGGGAACMIVGLGGVGAGIPLAIIGSVKSKKYCGGNRASLNLQSTRSGTGLALNF